MRDIIGYISVMNRNDVRIRPDRLRAGEGLSKAIDKALANGILSNYVEIGVAMGFNRTNIAHHKKGGRPMSREVVLRYAEVLQCSPEEIADDDVRMELTKDLERYESDTASYVVIDNYDESDRTPLKLPRDLISVENVHDSELSCICIHDEKNGRSNSPDQIAVIWSNGKKPVNSGKMHVVIIAGKPIIAKIDDDRKGYIITPDARTSLIQPMFRTSQELMKDGVVIAGQVLWLMSRV